jgi:hypothetical protein
VSDFFTVWGFWITAISFLIGIAGIIYGVWARNHPRSGMLAVVLTESSLVPTEVAAAGGMRVVYGDSDVSEPWITMVTVTNLGPVDLGPEAFKGGRLRFRSNGPGFIEGNLTDVPGEYIFDADNREDEHPTSYFDVSPCLLKVGDSFTLTLLSSEQPNVFVEAQLTGFGVRLPVEEAARRAEAIRRLAKEMAPRVLLLR